MSTDDSAKEKREMAARARRLARALVFDVDRQPLLDYADELERQAAALEHQQRLHSQQQQQQQSDAPPDDAQGDRRTPTE